VRIHSTIVPRSIESESRGIGTAELTSA